MSKRQSISKPELRRSTRLAPHKSDSDELTPPEGRVLRRQTSDADAAEPPARSTRARSISSTRSETASQPRRLSTRRRSSTPQAEQSSLAPERVQEVAKLSESPKRPATPLKGDKLALAAIPEGCAVDLANKENDTGSKSSPNRLSAELVKNNAKVKSPIVVLKSLTVRETQGSEYALRSLETRKSPIRRSHRLAHVSEDALTNQKKLLQLLPEREDASSANSFDSDSVIDVDNEDEFLSGTEYELSQVKDKSAQIKLKRKKQLSRSRIIGLSSDGDEDLASKAGGKKAKKQDLEESEIDAIVQETLLNKKLNDLTSEVSEEIDLELSEDVSELPKIEKITPKVSPIKKISPVQSKLSLKLKDNEKDEDKSNNSLPELKATEKENEERDEEDNEPVLIFNPATDITPEKRKQNVKEVSSKKLQKAVEDVETVHIKEIDDKRNSATKSSKASQDNEFIDDSDDDISFISYSAGSSKKSEERSKQNNEDRQKSVKNPPKNLTEDKEKEVEVVKEKSFYSSPNKTPERNEKVSEKEDEVVKQKFFSSSPNKTPESNTERLKVVQLLISPSKKSPILQDDVEFFTQLSNSSDMQRNNEGSVKSNSSKKLSEADLSINPFIVLSNVIIKKKDKEENDNINLLSSGKKRSGEEEEEEEEDVVLIESFDLSINTNLQQEVSKENNKKVSSEENKVNLVINKTQQEVDGENNTKLASEEEDDVVIIKSFNSLIKKNVQQKVDEENSKNQSSDEEEEEDDDVMVRSFNLLVKQQEINKEKCGDATIKSALLLEEENKNDGDDDSVSVNKNKENVTSVKLASSEDDEDLLIESFSTSIRSLEKRNSSELFDSPNKTKSNRNSCDQDQALFKSAIDKSTSSNDLKLKSFDSPIKADPNRKSFDKVQEKDLFNLTIDKSSSEEDSLLKSFNSPITAEANRKSFDEAQAKALFNLTIDKSSSEEDLTHSYDSSKKRKSVDDKPNIFKQSSIESSSDESDHKQKIENDFGSMLKSFTPVRNASPMKKMSELNEINEETRHQTKKCKKKSKKSSESKETQKLHKSTKNQQLPDKESDRIIILENIRIDQPSTSNQTSAIGLKSAFEVFRSLKTKQTLTKQEPKPTKQEPQPSKQKIKATKPEKKPKASEQETKPKLEQKSEESKLKKTRKRVNKKRKQIRLESDDDSDEVVSKKRSIDRPKSVIRSERIMDQIVDAQRKQMVCAQPSSSTFSYINDGWEVNKVKRIKPTVDRTLTVKDKIRHKSIDKKKEKKRSRLSQEKVNLIKHKIHSKDFKNLMIYDESRNSRVETKNVLSKKGLFFSK